MGQFDFSVLKTLRMKQGLTADDLAGKANLTRATIAKMENGFNNPTVQTLESLAGVFQLSTSDLLRLAEGMRLDHAKVEDFSSPGCAGKRIYFDTLEIFHLNAKADSHIDFDFELHEDTTEICFVLTGHLVLSVRDQPVSLKSGMAVRFDAMHEHQLNICEDAEFLMIHHRQV